MRAFFLILLVTLIVPIFLQETEQKELEETEPLFFDIDLNYSSDLTDTKLHPLKELDDFVR